MSWDSKYVRLADNIAQWCANLTAFNGELRFSAMALYFGFREIMAPAQDADPVHPDDRVHQEEILNGLSRIEKLLRESLEAQRYLQRSDAGRKFDHRSRFWATYEELAKKDDDEILEGYNGTLDVLLIFAGLFSGVSSSFIANAESNLQPNSARATNALLQLLVQAAYNQTAGVTSIVPSISEPDGTIAWTQVLAYASLFLSLLTAFIAVLGKQWLGYYKNTRFGHGSQETRCISRQAKRVAMDESYFYFILDSLLLLLQLSLLLFGIAVAGRIYVQQRATGGVIIGIISLGFLFYMITVTITLLYDNSPYQTGLSNSLRNFLRPVFTDLKQHFQNYANILKSKYQHFLGQNINNSGPPDTAPTLDLEEKGLQDFTPKGRMSRNPHKRPNKSHGAESCLAVQWILDKSTDSEVIETAINMIPEVVWPSQIDRKPIIERLRQYHDQYTKHGYASPAITVRRTRACDRAIIHLLWTNYEPSMDPLPLVWQSYERDDPAPEYICAKVHNAKKVLRKCPDICDGNWLSYMIPYIIIKRDSDKDRSTVTMNSILIWCSILKSGEDSKISKLNVLAGIACALKIPGCDFRDLIVFHDKSALEESMCIGIMNFFLKTSTCDISINDTSTFLYLLEPFSLVLTSLSFKVDFDLYPQLENFACWSLRLTFAILSLGKSATTSKPIFAIKRIYQSALRICGYMLRQRADRFGIVEEFHAKISEFELSRSPDVPKKLLDILEASVKDNMDLDLAADALLALGILGPVRISSSVLEICMPTLNACLTSTHYHRSTALYAIWAGLRHSQPARIAQLGSPRVFSSLLQISPRLESITDINLSLIISRKTLKDNGGELSVDLNLLSTLAEGILSLRDDFQRSVEEKFVNLARLPIQFIDLGMLIDNQNQQSTKTRARKGFLLSTKPFIEAGLCGWKWFEPHGYELLSGDHPIFWNTKSDIPTGIYLQLYVHFPAILSSFIVWTSRILKVTSILREPPDSSQHSSTADMRSLIEKTVEKLIHCIPEEMGRPADDMHQELTDDTPAQCPIRSLLTKFYGPGILKNLDSARKQDLESLLTKVQDLKKILTPTPTTSTKNVRKTVVIQGNLSTREISAVATAHKDIG